MTDIENTITPRHRVFIAAMIKGCNQADAYTTAYPKAKRDSAHSAACRLMNRTDIRTLIEDGRLILQQRMAAIKRQVIITRANRIKDSRDVLQGIYNGGLARKDTQLTGLDTTITKIKEDPALRLQAIKMDRKLEQEWEELILQAGEDLELLAELTDYTLPVHQQPEAIHQDEQEQENAATVTNEGVLIMQDTSITTAEKNMQKPDFSKHLLTIKSQRFPFPLLKNKIERQTSANGSP